MRKHAICIFIFTLVLAGVAALEVTAQAGGPMRAFHRGTEGRPIYERGITPKAVDLTHSARPKTTGEAIAAQARAAAGTIDPPQQPGPKLDDDTIKAAIGLKDEHAQEPSEKKDALDEESEFHHGPHHDPCKESEASRKKCEEIMFGVFPKPEETSHDAGSASVH